MAKIEVILKEEEKKLIQINARSLGMSDSTYLRFLAKREIKNEQ